MPRRACLLRFGLALILIGALAAGGRAWADDNGRVEPAQAAPITVPDGRFSSAIDFLAGTWVWERQQPRQTVQLRFGRDGDFFFHNVTSGLTHYGRYETKTASFRMIIHRTCQNNGRNCVNRNPPLDVEYPFRPTSANQFYSSDERWQRLRRE